MMVVHHWKLKSPFQLSLLFGNLRNGKKQQNGEWQRFHYLLWTLPSIELLCWLYWVSSLYLIPRCFFGFTSSVMLQLLSFLFFLFLLFLLCLLPFFFSPCDVLWATSDSCWLFAVVSGLLVNGSPVGPRWTQDLYPRLAFTPPSCDVLPTTSFVVSWLKDLLRMITGAPSSLIKPAGPSFMAKCHPAPRVFSLTRTSFSRS